MNQRLYQTRFRNDWRGARAQPEQESIVRRADTASEREHGACTVRSAYRRRAVEITVPSFHQPRKRNRPLAGRTAKRVKRGQAPNRIDAKDRALNVRTAQRGGAVEITVTSLHQRSDWISAFAGRAAKRVKRGQVPCCINLEDGAFRVRAAQCRSSVEIAVAALY